MSKVLSGKTIVITRPAHQAKPLADLITDLGGKPLIFPTLEILGMTHDPSLLAAANAIDQYQFAIFVSANAVHYSLKVIKSLALPTVIAIGPGTAQALQEYGVRVACLPESHHSEGLLALPLLQNIDDKKIAIFCGEKTRPLLKTVLSQRGALVDEIVCYRRRCPNVDIAPVLSLWQATGIDLIISTSSESLENLWQLFAKLAADWLRHIPLLVISPRMAEQAKQLGFESVTIAEGASDQAISNALQTERRNQC